MRDIVVVGPGTASVYPEPLFARGVTVLGSAAQVTDASKDDTSSSAKCCSRI